MAPDRQDEGQAGHARWGDWLCAALAHAGQPEHLFRAVDAAVKEDIGRTYTTVLTIRDGTRSMRVFSTVPDVYPVGGAKLLPASGWLKHVVADQKPFLASTDAELNAAYPDADTVRGLGCGTLMNAPAVYDGRVVGLLNVAHTAGAYGAAQLTRLLPYAAVLAPVLHLLTLTAEKPE